MTTKAIMITTTTTTTTAVATRLLATDEHDGDDVAGGDESRRETDAELDETTIPTKTTAVVIEAVAAAAAEKKKQATMNDLSKTDKSTEIPSGKEGENLKQAHQLQQQKQRRQSNLFSASSEAGKVLHSLETSSATHVLSQLLVALIPTLLFAVTQNAKDLVTAHRDLCRHAGVLDEEGEGPNKRQEARGKASSLSRREAANAGVVRFLPPLLAIALEDVHKRAHFAVQTLNQADRTALTGMLLPPPLGSTGAVAKMSAKAQEQQRQQQRPTALEAVDAFALGLADFEVLLSRAHTLLHTFSFVAPIIKGNVNASERSSCSDDGNGSGNKVPQRYARVPASLEWVDSVLAMGAPTVWTTAVLEAGRAKGKAAAKRSREERVVVMTASQKVAVSAELEWRLAGIGGCSNS
mmetsp:Transcript_30245/g.51059  ORF Transcript_30245/g.51059 Transcript_30245/m.51059 type:complete len:409 (-) Transcript_30245:47-1273(-)